MKRDINAVRRIATESGLPIVASGGYYMQRTYLADIANKTADQIADDLVREASAQHLGAFGEIGQQGGVLAAGERTMFEAIGQAHVRSGLPVSRTTRTPGSVRRRILCRATAALRQLDILEAQGAMLQNIVIGHVCCLDDPAADIAIQLAKRGVFVGFDRVTLEAGMPEPTLRRIFIDNPRRFLAFVPKEM